MDHNNREKFFSELQQSILEDILNLQLKLSALRKYAPELELLQLARQLGPNSINENPGIHSCCLTRIEVLLPNEAQKLLKSDTAAVRVLLRCIEERVNKNSSEAIFKIRENLTIISNYLHFNHLYISHLECASSAFSDEINTTIAELHFAQIEVALSHARLALFVINSSVANEDDYEVMYASLDRALNVITEAKKHISLLHNTNIIDEESFENVEKRINEYNYFLYQIKLKYLVNLYKKDISNFKNPDSRQDFLCAYDAYIAVITALPFSPELRQQIIQKFNDSILEGIDDPECHNFMLSIFDEYRTYTLENFLLEDKMKQNKYVMDFLNLLITEDTNALIKAETASQIEPTSLTTLARFNKVANVKSRHTFIAKASCMTYFVNLSGEKSEIAVNARESYDESLLQTMLSNKVNENLQNIYIVLFINYICLMIDIIDSFNSQNDREEMNKFVVSFRNITLKIDEIKYSGVYGAKKYVSKIRAPHLHLIKAASQRFFASWQSFYIRIGIEEKIEGIVTVEPKIEVPEILQALAAAKMEAAKDKKAAEAEETAKRIAARKAEEAKKEAKRLERQAQDIRNKAQQEIASVFRSGEEIDVKYSPMNMQQYTSDTAVLISNTIISVHDNWFKILEIYRNDEFRDIINSNLLKYHCLQVDLIYCYVRVACEVNKKARVAKKKSVSNTRVFSVSERDEILFEALDCIGGFIESCDVGDSKIVCGEHILEAIEKALDIFISQGINTQNAQKIYQCWRLLAKANKSKPDLGVRFLREKLQLFVTNKEKSDSKLLNEFLLRIIDGSSWIPESIDPARYVVICDYAKSKAKKPNGNGTKVGKSQKIEMDAKKHSSHGQVYIDKNKKKALEKKETKSSAEIATQDSLAAPEPSLPSAVPEPQPSAPKPKDLPPLVTAQELPSTTPELQSSPAAVQMQALATSSKSLVPSSPSVAPMTAAISEEIACPPPAKQKHKSYTKPPTQSELLTNLFTATQNFIINRLYTLPHCQNATISIVGGLPNAIRDGVSKYMEHFPCGVADVDIRIKAMTIEELEAIGRDLKDSGFRQIPYKPSNFYTYTEIMPGVFIKVDITLEQINPAQQKKRFAFEELEFSVNKDGSYKIQNVPNLDECFRLVGCKTYAELLEDNAIEFIRAPIYAFLHAKKLPPDLVDFIKANSAAIIKKLPSDVFANFIDKIFGRGFAATLLQSAVENDQNSAEVRALFNVLASVFSQFVEVLINKNLRFLPNEKEREELFKFIYEQFAIIDNSSLKRKPIKTAKIIALLLLIPCVIALENQKNSNLNNLADKFIEEMFDCTKTDEISKLKEILLPMIKKELFGYIGNFNKLCPIHLYGGGELVMREISYKRKLKDGKVEQRTTFIQLPPQLPYQLLIPQQYLRAQSEMFVMLQDLNLNYDQTTGTLSEKEGLTELENNILEEYFEPNNDTPSLPQSPSPLIDVATSKSSPIQPSLTTLLPANTDAAIIASMKQQSETQALQKNSKATAQLIQDPRNSFHGDFNSTV